MSSLMLSLGTDRSAFGPVQIAPNHLGRLKFSFVNIMDKDRPQQASHGTCPILASIFSDEFTVFSAKKFPGVIESTAISKCFATQGIKIPIRKDGPRGNQGENSNENDDD